MNKRALLFGLAYSLLAIAFKLFILLGGYTLTHFGFYYSNIVAVFFIIPFFIMTIAAVRRDNGGVISGRDAARMAITVLAVAVVMLSIYHYIEFEWKYGEIAREYYQGPEYRAILERFHAQQPDKIKTSDFGRIIQEQMSDLSAFKATTGRLVPLLFIGLSGAFLTAVLMKRNVPVQR